MAQRVDIVLAHYNEDLSWVRPWISQHSVAKIYHKGGYGDRLRSVVRRWGGEWEGGGGSGSSGRSSSGRSSSSSVVSLPNVGRESHTYLYHIVNHWEELADWTVFFQGGQPSWGYRMSKADRFRYLQRGITTGGHLCSGVGIGDYLANRNPLFYIRTAEVRGDLSQQRMRNLYTRYYTPEQLGGRVQSYPLENHLDHWGAWTDFRYRYISFRPFPETIVFAQGAQFSVSRDWIRQRPLVYYQDLLELLSHEKDPYLGYYMEWLWGEIWNPPLQE